MFLYELWCFYDNEMRTVTFTRLKNNCNIIFLSYTLSSCLLTLSKGWVNQKFNLWEVSSFKLYGFHVSSTQTTCRAHCKFVTIWCTSTGCFCVNISKKCVSLIIILHFYHVPPVISVLHLYTTSSFLKQTMLQNQKLFKGSF